MENKKTIILDYVLLISFSIFFSVLPLYVLFLCNLSAFPLRASISTLNITIITAGGYFISGYFWRKMKPVKLLYSSLIWGVLTLFTVILVFVVLYILSARDPDPLGKGLVMYYGISFSIIYLIYGNISGFLIHIIYRLKYRIFISVVLVLGFVLLTYVRHVENKYIIENVSINKIEKIIDNDNVEELIKYSAHENYNTRRKVVDALYNYEINEDITDLLLNRLKTDKVSRLKYNTYIEKDIVYHVINLLYKSVNKDKLKNLPEILIERYKGSKDLNFKRMILTRLPMDYKKELILDFLKNELGSHKDDKFFKDILQNKINEYKKH